MKDIYILGAKINDISLNEAIQQIADFLLSGQKGYVVTPNPEICLISCKDKKFRRILQNSFLSIPDGAGLKIGARIFGDRLNNKTTGADLAEKILKLSEQKDYSMLLLGGKQEVGERAKNSLKQKLPNLKLNYLAGGNFDLQGNSNQLNLINQINQINPDIIFVCLGAPKQEYFMSANQEKLNAKLMLGLGGTIDFLADQVPRAPENFRKLGLEWLWRGFKEPWRWPRIFKAVIIFPLACLRWKFGNLFIYRNNVAGMIINSQKQILVCKHSNVGYWQLPQGGVKKGENLNAAIIREMSDEIGTNKFEMVNVVANCYKYNWRKESRDIDKYKGQRQSIFLLEFKGENQDIKLSPHEFTDYQWVNKNEILQIVPDFKGEIIKIGLENFKDYL